MASKQVAAPTQRVSRLLITSNDGSQRMFRSCESILTKHADRLMMLRFKVPAARMGQKLFGPDRGIKAMLVTDREHVENILMSISS